MTVTASGNLRILLVDDNGTNLEVYKRILRQIPNLECVAYMMPEEALSWAAANEPDLIVVDYEMPKLNGLEFIERFRMFRGRTLTPIVMLTASQERDVRHRALELGATDFLTKPADPVEFVARVRNLLALRDGQKKLADQAAWLTQEVQKATAQLAEREREAIFQLLRIAEFRDADTASHIVRMGHLAALLAETLGESPSDVELLRLAAPMHDIGKVATPDHILLKRGALTSDEWKIMRAHATAGYEILKVSNSVLLRAGATIALTHHEKFDGSGYPYGTKGEDIPLAGRITALVDVFDALTSKRPYKEAWPMSEALDRIKQDAGKHFDPRLVEAFFTVIPRVNAIKVRYANVQVV